MTSGSASFDTSQGKRLGWLNLTKDLKLPVWHWEAGRENDGVRFLVEHGKAKTWAEAYRRGMRAAERLLAAEVAP